MLSHLIGVLEHLSQSYWDLVVLVGLVQVELDWTRVRVSVSDSPALGLSLLHLEGLCSQVDQVAAHAQVGAWVLTAWFIINQSNQWNSATSPGARWRSHIVDSDAQSSQSVLNKCSSSVTHSGTKGTVEHAWVTRSTLVTKEMGDWSKRFLFRVGTVALSSLDLFVGHIGNKFLSFDLGELDAARKLVLNQKLLLEEVWKRVEERVRPWGQQVSNLAILLEQLLLQLSNRLNISLLVTESASAIIAMDLFLGINENLVDLLNQLVEAGQVFQ